MNPFDPPRQVEDRATRARAVALARERGVRLPTFAEDCRSLARAAVDPRDARRDRSGRAARGESLSRQLVQRASTGEASATAPVARRDTRRPERRAGAHRRRARRAVPDDRRAQGARRVCVPRAAPRLRPLRSHPPARGLALDRQLLPRRRCDLAHPRLPRRRGAAGRHERRALRVARALGRESRRTSFARRAPRATSRRSTTAAPSWRAIRPTRSSTSSASSGTTSATGAAPDRRSARVFESLAGARPACSPRRLRRGERLFGNARRGRLPQGEVRGADRGGRGGRVPDAAQQRLRRAQHPGYRRQARAADPQRDEHRPGDRRERPGDRRIERSLQHRNWARLPRTGGPGWRRSCSTCCAGSGCPACATCWPRSSSRGTTTSAPTTWW